MRLPCLEEQFAPRLRVVSRLTFLGLLLVGCGSSSSAPPKIDAGGAGGAGGTIGSGSGGSGGSSTISGSAGSGGSGGGSGSGGSTGGAGGSGGSGTGGSSGGNEDAAPPPAADAGGPPTSSDGGPGPGSGGNPNNKCFTANIDNGRMLAGLSAEDFCDGYEKYCKYVKDDPTAMSKCGTGQHTGRLFMDRAECIAKYNAASAGSKACRAGQMCRNGKDGLATKNQGLIVNACSHATGYCASTCGPPVQ